MKANKKERKVHSQISHSNVILKSLVILQQILYRLPENAQNR